MPRAAAWQPDLAPAAAIGGAAQPTSIKRKAMIGGVEVEVEVPTVRKNSAVEQFGPESRHPRARSFARTARVRG
jgi:hypothetical protein